MRLILYLMPLAAAYAQPDCRPCHQRIYDSYQLTGMARSFRSASTPVPEVEDFIHEPSNSHYSLLQKDGSYLQRRWEIGFDGGETNIDEPRIDYVLGSGNHAKTFLHRTARGTLTQLPLGWYAEKGGYWGMNPGYDTAHPPARRPIAYECMFCHNGYPKIAAGHEAPGSEPVYVGELPQGIDCQRCHGSGAAHLKAVRSAGATVDAARRSIVNPARLSKERQMEVCLQCHLETTSTSLPNALRRFNRTPFGYRPGEPLASFSVSFDHAPGTGHDDKFEIAGSAYRFRQSQCFLQSKGELTCTTCHDPHSIPRGDQAAKQYTKVCLDCHDSRLKGMIAQGKHAPDQNCVSCHMPKRRTEDAVHVVMTDHRIQRRLPPGDLQAEIPESHPIAAERYRGEVALYYPPVLPPTSENNLYRALAQVVHGSNLEPGTARLESALSAGTPFQADFLMALGDAWRNEGQPRSAINKYERVLKLRPNSASASRSLGAALATTGDNSHAAQALERAVRLDPNDALSWQELGLFQANQQLSASAIESLQHAVSLNPDLVDSWNALGGVLMNSGNPTRAEKAFRAALQIDPSYGPAHALLARTLAERGDHAEALYHYQRTAQLRPGSATDVYELALALVRLNRFDESEACVQEAITLNPNLAEAYELLGGLLARRHDVEGSLRQFGTAVRLKPDFPRAQLDLGATLAGKGDTAAAIPHLREAAKGSDAKVAQQATNALRQLGVAP